MITRDYCLTMARYNAWQNKQLIEPFKGIEPAELTRDRGAFFGSILGTANHLMWGDGVWMARFDGGDGPEGGIPHSAALHGDLVQWRDARTKMDARILDWARSMKDDDLQGVMTWFSGAMGREVSKPMALYVAHMFNHQTHHRGQIHAMLTASGAKAPVSDLFYMPDDNS